MPTLRETTNDQSLSGTLIGGWVLMLKFKKKEKEKDEKFWWSRQPYKNILTEIFLIIYLLHIQVLNTERCLIPQCLVSFKSCVEHVPFLCDHDARIGFDLTLESFCIRWILLQLGIGGFLFWTFGNRWALQSIFKLSPRSWLFGGPCGKLKMILFLWAQKSCPFPWSYILAVWFLNQWARLKRIIKNPKTFTKIWLWSILRAGLRCS